MADCATREDQCHPRKIFVGGLAHKTTTQNLRDYFGHYGSIVDAVVLRWPDGRSRGFGYVTFAETAAASLALKESHQVGGREVDVKRAVPGTNKLFVGGLPQNTTAAELREHFESFGVVSDAVVMIDPSTNRSRGFGFACFLPGQEGAAAVAAALEQYQHHRIRGKWIEVKSAAPPHKLAAKEAREDAHGVVTPDSLSSGVEAANAAPAFAPPGLPASTRSPTPAEPQKVSSFSSISAPAGLTSKASRALPDVSTLPPPRLPNVMGWQTSGGGAASGVRPETRNMMSKPANNMLAEAPVSLPLQRSDIYQVNLEDTAGVGSSLDPVKVHVGSRSGYFDASTDLQRSLEQLLRLRSEQAGQKVHGEAALLAEKDDVAIESILSESPMSLTKMEK